MLNTSKVWDLSRGFLPAKDQIEKLPKKYAAWEELAKETPKLLAAGEFGKQIKNMPILDIDELGTEEELECAMRHLSFWGHSEVWESWQTIPKQFVSAQIAIPWCKVAKKLERPPVLSYASYALYNWKHLNKKKPVLLGNIALLQNFLGGIDEEWFILVHVEIEMLASQLWLDRSVGFPNCLTNEGLMGDIERIRTFSWLEHVAVILTFINNALSRMTENCDPYIYYNRVRPYIHGWKGNPRLSQGIIYEGVAEFGGKPQQWRGETGAQSTVIPTLDAFLGIEHSDTLPDGSPDILKAYLLEMRDYMPKEHRKFLLELEKRFAQNSIRQYVLQNKSKDAVFLDTYNACVQGVANFREKHLEYAGSYIYKQAQTSPYNPTGTGTGGTPFMKYLKKHLDETSASIIR